MTNEKLELLIKECGVELYDTEVAMENGRKIFRVYLMSPNGITLEDCTKVTQIISPILDLEPPVSGQYYLEVSSPGIERKLTKPSHFQNSIGLLVKIKTDESFVGKIVSCENDKLTLEIDNVNKEFDLSSINKAKTVVVW